MVRRQPDLSPDPVESMALARIESRSSLATKICPRPFSAASRAEASVEKAAFMLSVS